MFQLQLGNILINRIVESERADAYFDPLFFFPETTLQDWEGHKSWLQPRFQAPDTGRLIFTVQSFLLRTRHHTILIDTCVGNHRTSTSPDFGRVTERQAPFSPYSLSHIGCFSWLLAATTG